MANSLDLTTSYAGERALPYIAPAILTADSITNGYVTRHENVKKSITMRKLSGGVIQAAACDFTISEDELALTERVLTPTELMVNQEFCKKDFRQDWEAMNTGRGFINDVLPPDFQSFLLLYMARIVQAGIERGIWHGEYNETTGGTTGGNAVDTFNGILAKIVAGSANAGYDGEVAGAFTADADGTTGVLTHLDAIVANAPDTVQNDPNSVLMMSRKSLFLLQRAMAGLVTTSGGVSPTFVGDNRPTQFLGFPVIVPSGFPNDTILLSSVENFHFGTDLISDFNEAVVVDMTRTDASDNVRVAMRFTAGVQVADLGSLAVVRRTS